MMSRLVLVGMVAALGITVPTWPEIRECLRSGHAWAAARLADLDAARFRGVEPPMAFPSPSHRPSTFASIVPDVDIKKVADELNRAAEGLDLPAGLLVVQRQRQAAPTKEMASRRLRRGSAVVPSPDAEECKQIREMLETARRSGAESAATDSPLALRRSKPVIPPIACVFVASATRATAPAAGTSSLVGATVTVTVSKPTIEPIDPIEASPTDVAAALNHFAEGTVLAAGYPIISRAPKLAFTPIDPAASAQSSLADELNQAADGLPLVSSPPILDDAGKRTLAGRFPPPGRAPQVALAMRLTRDAIHAWARVIAGPATVQVSAR